MKTLLAQLEVGASAGIVAAIAVAVFFFIRGAIQLRPFGVPGDLASALFGDATNGSGPVDQLRDGAVLGIEILAYSVLHLITFAVVGAVAVFIVDSSTVWRSIWSGAAYAGVACTGLLYLTRAIAGTPVALDVMGVREVLVVNVVAGVIIGLSLHLAERQHEHA